MGINNRYCAVCGKEKEHRYIEQAKLDLYIECDCERRLREEQEKKDTEYAREIATELRNKNSRLSLMGRKSSFKRAVTDKYNEVAVRGGKYLLSQLLKDGAEDMKNSLVLQGNRGSGKTFTACAIINGYNSSMPLKNSQKERILKERNNGYKINEFTPLKSPCKFITEMDLFALYYDDFNYRKTDGPLQELKCAEKLLVIDDVGSSNYDKNRVQSMFLNIVDYRYSEGLSMVLTTNLTKKELSDYLGDRVFDRLNSCCYFIDLTSPESRRLS